MRDQKGSVEVVVLVMTVLILGAIIGGAVACAKLETIEPGHVGVSVRKCSGGGVNPTPIPTGYYWRELFCEDVVEYPTNLQTLVLTNQEGEGNQRHDEAIIVTSAEGMPISVDISMSFTLDPAKVPALYAKFRQDVDHLKNTFLRQTIREALQATFAKYTAEQLYSDKREIARGEAQLFLTEKQIADGFIVQQFTINETRVPKQVTDAINSKVAMIQDAQRSEQEVRKKEAEAAQIVAAAKGNAEAQKLQADAQSYANKTISSSITPELVKYMNAQKWDGKLPTVTGGGTLPMVNVDAVR